MIDSQLDLSGWRSHQEQQKKIALGVKVLKWMRKLSTYVHFKTNLSHVRRLVIHSLQQVALETAMAAINKQFGKGSVARLGSMTGVL